MTLEEKQYLDKLQKELSVAQMKVEEIKREMRKYISTLGD